jgi:hypothetical protein
LLRVLGIDIAFSREGHAGSRIIRIGRITETTASTVSNVRNDGDATWMTAAIGQ